MPTPVAARGSPKPPRRACAGLAACMALAALAPGVAEAAGKADCPAARAAYSSRTTVLDLLLDPRTRAVLDRQGALKGLPPSFLQTTPPTFAAIITPRQLMTQSDFPLPGLPQGARAADALDAALAGVPVTEAAAVRRCARYDHQAPALPKPDRRPAILVFEKITGFRDSPSVNAAHQAFAGMAARRGWSITFTDNGAAFNRAQLRAYDAVVWNNISGDALTLPQEQAFRAYLAAGGGFAGVHGSAGDPAYVWDWYADRLIGARFIGHPLNPQFQAAKVVVEAPGSGVAAHLPKSWTMTEEWYSFAGSPRANGAHVLAHLDEASYSPGPRLAMGDHPIAWTRCIGDGRAFYTAIGHRPESYTQPESISLLEEGVAWAAGQGTTRCASGHEVRRNGAGG